VNRELNFVQTISGSPPWKIQFLYFDSPLPFLRASPTQTRYVADVTSVIVNIMFYSSHPLFFFVVVADGAANAKRRKLLVGADDKPLTGVERPSSCRDQRQNEPLTVAGDDSATVRTRPSSRQQRRVRQSTSPVVVTGARPSQVNKNEYLIRKSVEAKLVRGW
jgi:hypothetical protein